MKIKNIYIETVRRPLKVLFSTSLGSKNHLKCIIIKVELDNGVSGTGECPTSFVSKIEDTETIKRILRDARKFLQNKNIENLENEISFLRKKFSEFPMTVSGLEVALFRAYLTSQNQNEHSFWGANLTHIETDITIPFLTVLEPLKRWLDDCIKKGFRIFKIKVIGDIELDTHLLLNVYGILQDSLEEFKIRLDGNQGFTEKSFFKLQDIIEKKGIHIECFEQPLLKNNYTGMKNVKKYSHFPVILDETVFNADDMYRAISEDICHGVNIKVAKSGIYESKKIIDLAKKHHLKLMIGCMTETMVGLSAGIYMACGTGVFDFIDLDSIYYLKYKKHYGNIHLSTPFYFISDL